MGKTQFTINPSYYKMMDAKKNRIKQEVLAKGEELVSYAVAISPVDTGAYVESFSVVPRGGGGGRSRSSENRPSLGLGQKDSVKQDEISRLRAEVRAIDPFEETGFTFRNRAPHNKIVEDKHNVLLRTKNRFR